MDPKYSMLATICWFVILAIHVDSVKASLRCNCKKAKCVKPTNCMLGTRKDMCGCCDVCAKREGELCGGKHFSAGECGDKLQCMVRHIKSNRNRDKQSVSELIGRCEYVPCHYKSCPFGQLCSLIKDVPTCTCPKCQDMIMSPVCGENNGKTYENECKLREAECLKGKEIGMLKGPCTDKNSSHVYCRDDSIRIELLKTFVGSLNNKKLTLLDSQCQFKSNTTHFFVDTKLDECGTKSNFALTSVIYTNTIRSEIDPNAIIIRNRDSVQIPVECFYSIRAKSSSRVNIGSRGELGNRIEERLRGNGVGVRIREDGRNQRSVTGDDVIVDIDSDSKYFVELRAKALSSTSSAHLFPKFCYATPVQRSERWMKYTLVEDGCPVEDGVEILDSKTPFIRLLIPGIHFYNTKHPGVLVRCKLRACFPKDPNDIKMCLPKCKKNNNNNNNNQDDENKRKRKRRKRRETLPSGLFKDGRLLISRETSPTLDFDSEATVLTKH